MNKKQEVTKKIIEVYGNLDNFYNSDSYKALDPKKQQDYKKILDKTYNNSFIVSGDIRSSQQALDPFGSILNNDLPISLPSSPPSIPTLGEGEKPYSYKIPALNNIKENLIGKYGTLDNFYKSNDFISLDDKKKEKLKSYMLSI